MTRTVRVMKLTKKVGFKFEPFSRKQKKVFTWWLPQSPACDKDGIIADGAIRSGKTVSMALSFVIWAMNSFKGQNFAMCGKTIGSFRRNVLSVLKLMLITRGYRMKDHRSDNLLVITRNDVTNYFYIFGGKDESSQDLIQGITLAGLFCDEVALMPESFVNQATGRCSINGSKFWFNCNPDGPFHWFKAKWIDDRKKKNLFYLHFTMDDNLSLSENIKKRYRDMYRGVFYERYILGLWKAAEGIIYSMFEEAKHVVKDISRFSKDYYVSVDYGTQNPTVFLLFARDKFRPKEWCCIKEYYYSGRDTKVQKTDAEFEHDLKEFIGNKPIKAVVVDPSAASFIALLRQKGYRVLKGNNDVLDGIRYVATLLSEGRLFFHESCENTFAEFHTYAWDEKAQEKGEDAPIKQFDHCLDSLRYFSYTVIRHTDKRNIKNQSR